MAFLKFHFGSPVCVDRRSWGKMYETRWRREEIKVCKTEEIKGRRWNGRTFSPTSSVIIHSTVPILNKFSLALIVENLFSTRTNDFQLNYTHIRFNFTVFFKVEKRDGEGVNLCPMIREWNPLSSEGCGGPKSSPGSIRLRIFATTAHVGKDAATDI